VLVAAVGAANRGIDAAGISVATGTAKDRPLELLVFDQILVPTGVLADPADGDPVAFPRSKVIIARTVSESLSRAIDVWVP
jgi:hypothetical protein